MGEDPEKAYRSGMLNMLNLGPRPIFHPNLVDLMAAWSTFEGGKSAIAHEITMRLHDLGTRHRLVQLCHEGCLVPWGRWRLISLKGLKSGTSQSIRAQ